jgi:hypothetical protein
MYIDIVPNRGSPPAILLRESIRDGKRVRKRTVANLSALPIAQVEMIRRVLKGEKLGPVESALEVVRSRSPRGPRRSSSKPTTSSPPSPCSQDRNRPPIPTD